MKIKKWLITCLALIVGLFGFVGCDCGKEEEPEDKKYLRLYDLDKSGVVDDWETPFNHNTQDGVAYGSRDYVDNNGNTIAKKDIVEINNDNDLNAIISMSKESSFKNKVLEFKNGTYFARNDNHKLACYGARAYIVHIASASELKSFASMNLTQVDSHKYILTLDSDISFRTGDSTGSPLDVFGKEEVINLNGASLYGNGKTLEGFTMRPNSMSSLYDKQGTEETEEGRYDSVNTASVTNIKYSLISNAVAIYDLNIYLGYNNVSIDPAIGINTTPYSLIIDFAPLRNVGIIDNIKTRGKVDINTSNTNAGYGAENTNVEISKVNVSMLAIGEDDSASALTNTQFDYTYYPKGSEEIPEGTEYDYDLVIKTDRLDEEKFEKNDKGEDVFVGIDHTYTHSYDSKIKNVSITNSVVEGYINYEEKIKEKKLDTENNEVLTYFDASKKLNIGGIYANADGGYNNVCNNSSDIKVNIVSGGSVAIGGITSDLTYNAFAENNDAKLKLNMQSVGDSASTIGGLVGRVEDMAELKNSVADIQAVIVGESNITGKTTSHIAIGGAVGLNKGYAVYCDTSSNVNVTNCDIVSSGAVAGASYNGVFVKNLANANVYIQDAENAYSGTVVGSAVGGMIYKTIAQMYAFISAYSDRSASDIMDYSLSQAGMISSGLLYFQSQNFYTNFCEITKIYNADKDNAMKADSLFKNGIIYLGAEYAPKCVDNLVTDNTDINMQLKELPPEKDEQGDTIEVIEEYAGSYVNIGGFFVYRFLNGAYPYEAVNNLRSYNSSFKINGSKDIYYYLPESEDGAEEEPEGAESSDGAQQIANASNVKVIKDLYSVSDNNRLSIVTELSLSYVKDYIELNGISKQGVAEIENTAIEGVTIADLKFNNIYPGRYLSPDNFQDLALDKDLFADLNIESYDELMYITDIFLNKDSSSDNIYNTTLRRKDLLNVMMFQANLFDYDTSNTLAYKQLILSKDSDSDYRYQRDVQGNLEYTLSKVKNGENGTSSAFGELYFGKDDDGKIYVFKKSSLNNTATTVEGVTTITYHLPTGYVELNDTEKNLVNTLNDIEIMMLYRITQIMGVKCIEIEINPNSVATKEIDAYSKLLMKIYYRSSDTRVSTYCLDTMKQKGSTNTSYTCLFYMVKEVL